MTATFEVHHGYENGARIVYVHFSNSIGKCKLLEKDYDQLVKLHVGPPWKYAVGQVIVRSGGKDIPVARLILDAGKGEAIRHIDRNSTNLLRANLLRVAGHGCHRSRDLIRCAYKFRPEIIHKEIHYKEGYLPR
jgi:hypothetical protein